MLDEKAVKIINEILSRGGTVEIRRKKGEIVIIELKGKIKYTVITGA